MSILDFWALESPPRPVQVKTLLWLEKNNDKKYLFVDLPVGCHAPGTEVIMYDGTFKSVENIVVGDILLGPDSTPRTVHTLYSGVDEMYKVTPTKGDSFIVNQHHILSLTQTPTSNKYPNKYNIINISVIDYINKSSFFKYNHKLYRSTGVEFNNKNILPIDSYMLGLYLGDGHGALNSVVGITSMDPEILNYIQKYATLNSIRVKEDVHNNKGLATLFFRGGLIEKSANGKYKNLFAEQLRELSLLGCNSGEKFIPNIYKVASTQDRLNLLAGLIDTDGYYDGIFSICTKSKQMANDIMFIARSLGFAAYQYVYLHKQLDTNYYSIRISGNIDLIPTLIPRKQARLRKQIKRTTVTGCNVSHIGLGEYYGFGIDKDHLYMLSDFTITHNSGKSAIGVTYAKWVNATNGRGYEASFIMTPQKILQAQYEQSFMGDNVKATFMQSMYGQSNYKCANKKTTCNVGALLKPRCTLCPYQEARKRAVAAKHVIFNYALALAAFQYTDVYAPRNVIVFDECHNIENILTEYNNVAITASSCEHHGLKLVKSRDFAEVLKWMTDIYYPRMDDVLAQLTDECEYIFGRTDVALSREEIHQLQKLYSLTEHLGLVHSFITTDPIKLQKQYVLTYDKDSIKFKFLFGRENFKRILSKQADKFLFMSATIFDAVEMCRCLGIPENEMAYMSATSDFPAENRPVFYNPIMKMNYGWNNSENSVGRRKMIKGILSVLDTHMEDHGIIHTGNYAIAEWLVEELADNGTHEVLHHNAGSTDSRDVVLKLFTMSKKPTILISPSITEGLDLFDDKARFAIFAKVPFGAMGDAWIKKRMEISQHWYLVRALTDIMQGCGRVVRSKEDWGVVYILDESWSYLYNRMVRYIPKWWKEGYIAK